MSRIAVVVGTVLLSGALARPAFSAETAQAPPPAAAPAAAKAPASAPAGEAVPSDPSIQLNYGSILFYKGLRLLRSGDLENGKALFKEVEHHLRESIRLAAQDSDPVRRQLTQSQAAFLLGEVNQFVWRDAGAAKSYYQQAAAAYPEHDGAREKLKSIQIQEQSKP